MSRRSTGQFAYVDDRNVPTQLASVPRDHWHNYPAGCQDRDNNTRGHRHHRYGRYAQPAHDNGNH